VTPSGQVTEFTGFTPGARPLAPTATATHIWVSDSIASRVARIDMDGHVTEFATPRPNSGPRAIVPGPDGNIWFVLAEGNAIGRVSPSGEMHEFPLPTPNASPRGIVVARGEIWFTQNLINRIGRMSLTGELLAEYDIPTPGSGARAMLAMPDGRLYFSQHDIGCIGEIRPAD